MWSLLCAPHLLFQLKLRGAHLSCPSHNPCRLERILRITFEWKAPPFDQIRVCQLDFWPFSCPYFCSLIPSQFCPRLFFVPTRPQPSYWSGHLLCKKLFVLFKSHQNLSTPQCFVWSRPFLSDSEVQIIWTLLLTITQAMIYVDSGMSLCSIIFFFQSFWTLMFPNKCWPRRPPRECISRKSHKPQNVFLAAPF